MEVFYKPPTGFYKPKGGQFLITLTIFEECLGGHTSAIILYIAIFIYIYSPSGAIYIYTLVEVYGGFYKLPQGLYKAKGWSDVRQ